MKPSATTLQPQPHRPSRLHTVMIALSAMTLLGCEQPNPLQQAELIGEMPVWGQHFGKDDPKDLGAGSMLSPDAPQGRIPTGPDGVKQTGGSAVPGANPMKKGSWSAGDKVAGQRVFSNTCALCHGAAGQGGQLMGLDVPTLRNAGWHEKVDDGYLGSTIAHGKGKMPGFIGQLSKKDINDVIAFVRTLKLVPRATPKAPVEGAPVEKAPPKRPQAPTTTGY